MPITRAPYRPEESAESGGNPHSDRPSYLPPGFEEKDIHEAWKKGMEFWSIDKVLSLESAYALREAEDVMDELYVNGTLESMGLDPNVPKHESFEAHRRRVAIYLLLISDRTINGSLTKMPSKRILAISGILHDIGKLEPNIYGVVGADNKWGKDAQTAWQLIKQHPRVGAEVVYAMPGLRSSEERIEVANTIFQHHENYDGTGYERMKGDNICIAARMLRVADTVAAMSERRSYKNGKPPTALDIEGELIGDEDMYDPGILGIIKKVRRTNSGVFTKLRKPH